jgi:hypothetical protein
LCCIIGDLENCFDLCKKYTLQECYWKYILKNKMMLVIKIHVDIMKQNKVLWSIKYVYITYKTDIAKHSLGITFVYSIYIEFHKAGPTLYSYI